MPTLDPLIVDDERLVRSELRRMLEPHDAVDVVGEAADATEAETAVEELDPDLLLLDVQMPDANGFDLLERLDDVPHVVFVTAYDEYAIRAFEVNALDYLVKPVEEERLAEALETVQEQAALSGEAMGPAPQPDPDESEEPDTLTADDQVFVKDGRRCWFVRLGEVRLFEAAGNYTRLYFGTEEPLVHRSLSSLEDRLAPFRQSMNRRFQRDIENLEEYFRSLEQEMQKNLEKPGLSEAARKDRQAKIEAIPAELESKKQDLFKKYSIKVRLQPAALMQIRTPAKKIACRLSIGKQRRQFFLTYNPVTRNIDFPPCTRCHKPLSHIHFDSQLKPVCVACKQ
mgnify:CR=1 FL=1